MRVAGLRVWEAHQAAARRLRPGVTTDELNRAVRDVFAHYAAEPLFLNYPGSHTPFPAETCISVNEEVVHGVPGSRVLKNGDLVSIDTGCRIDGWCGDAATTHALGMITPAAQQLMDVTRGALDLAIDLLGRCRWWSQIARQMQEYVEGRGLSVVTELVGHAIGRDMHEPPQVPNYYSDEIATTHDFDIRPGLVLAIEPMVNQGTHQLKTLPDHWTIVTADSKLSAHFEHTVAITRDGPRRLTEHPSEDELDRVGPDFRDPTQWVRW